MSKPLEKRIGKLEKSITPDERPFRFLFCEVGETSEEARVRYNADKPDDLLCDDDNIMIIRWCKP
ncbi:MAG: hypothetical protein P8P30_04400 [Rickettsiales bacterium]|nr:hypothetical protein [Rickettsiales bacterium]